MYVSVISVVLRQRLVEKAGLSQDFHIDSAGTGSWHTGELPDARMRSHGSKRGYDFCSRARQFSVSDFDVFDYIVVMDDNNYQNVRNLAITVEHEAKIHRMTEFSQRFAHDYIPDPYYEGASGFELVLDLLEDACEGLLRHIQIQKG